jgi:hypothetical protein
LPFIGIRHRRWLRELYDVTLQRFTIGMFDHAEPHVSALASHGADNRRTIIRIRAMPFLFVRTPTRRIAGIMMFFAFFPPPSETSHPFQ